MTDDAELVTGIRAHIDDAAQRLRDAGARDEALAHYRPAHRVLRVFPRASVMEPLGRVWHLGVLLLAADGTLYTAGATTRVVPPGYPGHHSVSAEERREHRAAAERSTLERGDIVNYNATPVELDADALRSSTGPLFVRDGSALVRWSRTVGDEHARPFDDYLDERVQLLITPPEGA